MNEALESIRRANRILAEYAARKWPLVAAPLPAAPAPTERVIDLDAVDWEQIKQAASESNWMPPEYMRNDWVADVCEFLRDRSAALPTEQAGELPPLPQPMRVEFERPHGLVQLEYYTAEQMCQQRQEGRRDAHETNIVLTGENCKLSERLEWHKNALAATSGKLASVWEGISEAVQKYSGKPCEGEPFDRLDELLAALAARPAPTDAPKVLNFDDFDYCAIQNAIRNLEYIETGRYPSKDHDLDDGFVVANIGHAKKLASAVLPRLRAAATALRNACRQAPDSRDAARYRWLRDKSDPGICAFYLSVGKAFDGVKFNQDTVDCAIDAQIVAQEKAQ